MCDSSGAVSEEGESVRVVCEGEWKGSVWSCRNGEYLELPKSRVV